MGKKIEHKIVDGIEKKRCYKCKQWKPLDSFYKSKNMWDGFDKKCKICRKYYYTAHAEETKLRTKQYYINNAEELRQKNKQYHIDHIEEIKQKNKQYYIKHVGKMKQRAKQQRKQLALYGTYADQLICCEEIRQDEGFLEVKCTYCGKWIKPTRLQVQNRIKAIHGNSFGECRFYCSENCKAVCPIYNQTKYPKGFKKATSREVVPLLRQLVLKRDDYTCQKCGATTETAQLHVHHIISYAQNKMQANDPDSCITLCKFCHKEIHQQDGCKYHELKCGENKNV